MKNLSKKFIVIIIFILVIFSLLSFGYVKADSGWDSSYDSGGSWDSGSSWDSSSSWDYDYDGGYYSGTTIYTDDDGLGYIIIIIIIIVIIVVIANQIKINRNVNNSSKEFSYFDLTDDKIKYIDASIDKEKLKEEAFSIYKNIQESWMNMNYESLRKYKTDELYNMYESQLKKLKIKNQKNIMKDIELKNIKITDINITNGIEKITFYLNVNQYDYVVDSNNKVVRGNDKIKNNVEYIITLIRSMKDEKLDKCPNCGASIDIVSGGICPYCDSRIINSTNQFVMSKKECINQRKI